MTHPTAAAPPETDSSGTTSMIGAFFGLHDREPGQGLVEYALVIMLIAIVVIGSVAMFGQEVDQLYVLIECGFGGAGDGTGTTGC